MSVFSVIGKFFLGIGKSFSWIVAKIFSWDFLFGTGLTLGLRLLRFFGIIAFLSTFIIAGQVALQSGGTPQDMIGVFFLENVKNIVTFDHNIYKLSLEFNNINNPTLLQGFQYSFLTIKNLFFYVWWFRVLKWITRKTGLFKTDLSTPDFVVDWKIFKILYIFMIIGNLSYLIFIEKAVQFDFVDTAGYGAMVRLELIGHNIFNFINELFIKHWWHWLIAFKGVITATFLVWYRTVLLFSGTKVVQDIVSNATNMSNSTG